MVVPVAAAFLFQKTVALPDRAMRLDALLKAMGVASGEGYRATGPMASRVVIVAGPPRPVAAIRADLAAATFGRWRQSGTEWTLDEDRDAARARERRRLAARIAEVRTQQAKMRTEAGKPFDAGRAKALLAALNAFDKADDKNPQESYPQRRAADGLKFSSDAAKRVVASLDPVEIASLERGQAVWSDRPTRLQRPLPPGVATAVVGQMARDQAVWTGVFTDSTDWKASRRNGWQSDDPRGYPEPIAPGGLRTFVRAQAFEHGQTLFSVEFIDRNEALRQFGAVSIEFDDREERPDPSPKVDPKEPSIPLSPEAKAYSDAQRGRGRSPLLRPVLLRPERREPLDILFGEGLRGVAKARGKGVVAWLSDDLAPQGLGRYQGKGEEPSASGWLRAMWAFGDEILEGPDATVLRPRFGGTNMDRALVGPLCRTMDRVGYLPLDDAADYALATGANGQSADPLATVLFENAVPGWTQLTFRTPWKDLALWGGFSRAQRQSLLARGNLAWTDVSVAQRDRIVRAVLQADPNEIRPNGRHQDFRRTALSNEPTEILADLSAMGGGVRGLGSVEAAVFVRSTDDNPYNGGLASASSLAGAVVSREREPNVTHYDGLPKTFPDGFLYGRQIILQFSVDLSPSLQWNKYGGYGEIDLRAKPQPLETLPAEFRSAYDRSLESHRRPQG